MAIFNYKAKNKSAETVEGTVIARNKDEAVEKLNQLGLIPVLLQDNSVSPGAPTAQSGTVRGRDIFNFSRQLASFLKVGMSLLPALESIEKQIRNPYFRYIVGSLCSGVKDGKSLADSLSVYPRVFPPLYIAMVRAGEESGQLRDMLLNLASYQKTQEEIASRIRTAAAYPLLMLVFGIATIVFILTFVMPQITGLFGSLNDLPLPTVIVMQLSAVMKNAWWAILILAGLLYILLQQFFRSPVGHAALSRFQLTIPGLGDLVVKIQVARFCRSLELLLKSGISILRALRLAVPVVNNDVIRRELERCEGDLTGGGTLGKSLRKCTVVPVMVGDLVTVGEEAGTLSQTLKDIADEYEEEINERIKILMSLLEPVMIVIVGAVIGFMVIAMLLPVFQMDIYSR